jgi:hypothetical protein
VHGDHSVFVQRQNARRPRARDELADLLERLLRRVQHEVSGAAGVDDALEDAGEPLRPVAVVDRPDEDGLRLEESPE